jgi:hexosaminidase
MAVLSVLAIAPTVASEGSAVTAAATPAVASPGLPSHAVPQSSAVATSINVVPRPRFVQRLGGTLDLGRVVDVRTSDPAERRAADALARGLRPIGIAVASDAASAPPETGARIALHAHAGIRGLGQEGYRLAVSRGGVVISANAEAGLFYGVQTLLQLADDGTGARPIPRVVIVDRPEYSWRGLQLDVSRHFFPASVVERYIDVAARFKFNTFQWHLTDDQGWRIPIPGYPKLISVGSCRSATQTGGPGSDENDGTVSCAHYTTDEIRAVVAYAKARHVRIIPEIEGPGHAIEVLGAYPNLACRPGHYRTLEYWRSPRYALCPTEATFRFYDAVFREMARLFPGGIVHVGGDEVPYSAWAAAPVYRLMAREGIGAVEGVQDYFTQKLAHFARARGLRIAGWDELAEGAPRDAIVTAWHGASVAAKAAKRGNDVVLAFETPLYFDSYQDVPAHEPVAFGRLTTLRDVYAFDPADARASGAPRARILGAQGVIWSEYVPNERHLWYMTYPRALALAEALWTPRSRMQYVDFTRRAGIALRRLERDRVTFRLSDVGVEVERTRASRTATVTLTPPVPGATVRYTLDGSTPDYRSARYEGPLHLDLSRGSVRVAAIATISGYRPSAPARVTVYAR